MTQDTIREQTQSALDAEVECFVDIFSDIRRVLGAGFKQTHQRGLSTTQFIVMELMEKTREDEPLTISWIAGRLGIDPATVVRAVDSLEKRGLVQRRRDKRDRRQVFVEFMEAGRAAREEMQQRFKARIRAIFMAMSEEDRASLIRGLEAFVRVGQEVGDDVPLSKKGESYGC